MGRTPPGRAVTDERPELREADIVAELRHIHRKERRSLDTALYGRGAEGEVSAEVRGGPRRFAVVPVRCELDLRRALAHDGSVPRVALVDFDAERLPADLAGRIATGAVQSVSAESRIRRRFGVAALHPDVQRTRVLRDALRDEAVAPVAPSGAAQLDVDAAWRCLLAGVAGLAVEGAMGLPRLLLHCATVAPSAAWRSACERHAGLREALGEWLRRAVDPAAPALWRAWEENVGPAAAALTFALSAVAPRLASSAYLRREAKGWLARISPSLEDALGHDTAALARWGEAETWLARRLDADDPRALDALLKLADEALQREAHEPELREAVASSALLGLAWSRSLDDLAAALSECLPTPSADTFARARERFDRALRHRRATAHGDLVERARMALRLLGWIGQRPDLAHARTDGAPWEPALRLAHDYVLQGGHADLCRRDLRGTVEGGLGRALAAVEAEVDRLRDVDDRAFAESLRAWSGAGRRSEQAAPIERALDVFAVDFLKEQPHRRLLVVLLDGAAWANVAELLDDLEARGFGLLRWRPRAVTFTGPVPPVLAALPTVTQVSRAAFFAGRVPDPGDTRGTSLDPKRFEAHGGLKKVDGASPKLLLEPEVQTPSGHASPQALRLVGSEARVVGVVVNAIDDQLHGSRQVRVRYSLDTIKPLAGLLRAAAEHGRAVLLASDHGHVPGARLHSVGPRSEGQGARWRTLREGESPSAGEVVFTGAGVWTPKAGEKLSLRAQETEAWGLVSGDGEHGGATLAEVVAPAVMVVARDLARPTLDAEQDAGLEAVPVARPPWWDLEWKAPPKRDRAPTPEAPRQPTLPTLALEAPRKPTPAKPVAPAAPSKWAKMILSSAAYADLAADKKKRLREHVVPMVDALAERGWRVELQTLERALGLFPGRGEGAVSVASEILNLEGYPVLTFDPATRLVSLDADTLALLHASEGAR